MNKKNDSKKKHLLSILLLPLLILVALLGAILMSLGDE
jgi:flagellar basal body-associated protein FliL